MMFNISQALGSSFIGTLVFLATSFLLIGIFGDDVSRGINGLQFIYLLYYPIYVAVTLPIAVFVTKRFGVLRAPKITYSLLAILGLVVGVISSLSVIF